MAVAVVVSPTVVVEMVALVAVVREIPVTLVKVVPLVQMEIVVHHIPVVLEVISIHC